MRDHQNAGEIALVVRNERQRQGIGRFLLRQLVGILLAIGASFLWELNPIAEKIAIQLTIPENPLMVAFATTLLTVVLLTPALLRRAGNPLAQM